MMQGFTPYQQSQCEWIEPYPLESTQRCGDRQLAGCLYCEPHLARVGQKGTALRRRHKDIRLAQTVQSIDSLFNDVVAELEAAGLLEL
jgi:hypothetical protein